MYVECRRRGGEGGVVMVVVVGWERRKKRRSARGQMKGCSHRRVSTRVVVDLTCGWVVCCCSCECVGFGCVLGRRLRARARSQVCSAAGIHPTHQSSVVWSEALGRADEYSVRSASTEESTGAIRSLNRHHLPVCRVDLFPNPDPLADLDLTFRVGPFNH